MELALRWGAILTFASLVSLGYVCQAWVFRTSGSGQGWDLASIARVVFHPVFITGLALSFGSSVARLAMFERFGVSQTALVQQVAVVMMVLLSLAFFKEVLLARHVVGGFLVLAGVLLITRS